METKDKILEAAMQEFADFGYRRSTVRGICRRAGVNIAAVNYYFSGKEELYRQVFEWVIHARERIEPPAPGPVTTAAEFERELRNWIYRMVIRFVRRSRNRLDRTRSRIGLHEMMDPSELFPEMFERYSRPEMEAAEQLLQLALPPDTPRDTIRIKICNLLGQCFFYFVLREFVEQYTGEAGFPDRCHAEIIDEILQNTLRGLSFHGNRPA